ncbi:hypothetical protein B1R32_104178 [Abditibacterium utsteinense]|uniref:RiboL-PSP-HEPN domain-containing protein n=1 Tax=Abditibacterium utsteinense TaxID=1960156 RepID=A0A2S8SV78_9BACT|nr:MAE_28990/MAE_18760 family HEPN-like nuclease [Abditibacterium utsteinense]PQV64684.1 hypothetical protein B1R32_104178 [Abditibacterium utsteinense]
MPRKYPKYTRPDVKNLSAEIDEDYEWREREMRSFEQIFLGNDLLVEGHEFDRRRKCLIVMLYSHYEGFIKFALSVYAGALNNSGRSGLECRYVEDRIVSWSLSQVFSDLEGGGKKHPLFQSLPTDQEVIHRLYRRSQVVEHWRKLEETQINIPDEAYSTKSNLDYDRLRQLLYQINVDHDKFSASASQLMELCGRRNSIAHGDRENRQKGVSGEGEKGYFRIRERSFGAMKSVHQIIVTLLHEEAYLRPQYRRRA